MALATRIVDKAGVLGTLVSAMGCASCFPALASLGAAIGLGFLTRWEGFFVTTLIPIFALLALAANAVGWLGHRQAHRAVFGLIGPVLVLAAVIVMRVSGQRTGWLLYPGLLLMIAVSIWDLLSPPRRACAMPAREATSGQ